MPFAAPGSRAELTASAAISTMRATIITLTMRSTPPWRPPAQTPKPISTTTIIKPTQSLGSAVTAAKAAAICAAFIPTKSPRIILKKNKIIQPEIVV